MLKALRKYNKWILVIGGTLLMLAFLVQPAINQLSGDPGARPWATLDGGTLRMRDAQRAVGEIGAIERMSFGYYPASLGLDRQDGPTHWVLLVHEARRAGYVGESADGVEWLPDLMAEMYMQNRYGGSWRQFVQFSPDVLREYDQTRQRAEGSIDQIIDDTARASRLTPQETRAALSKLRGVLRMVNAYFDAAKVSDRRAAQAGREALDAAYVDYVFVPAALRAGQVPEPDEAAINEFFEKHKAVKPGQGEHGIGYLLPERLKLEWLALNAGAIRDTISLDPVALHKRYLRDRAKYPGEFGTERANVERDMKAERLAEVMQAAHQTIQAEVRKVTRRLESSGPYKTLPQDWEASRPRLETIAQAVVEQVQKSTGVTIPLPTVTVKGAEWVTRDETPVLEGIGSSTIQTGNTRLAFTDVVFGVRELRKAGAEDPTVPVQVGLPLIETAFLGPDESRYYATVLDARPESAPDSAAEIRSRVVDDFRRVAAYQELVPRAEEFRSLVAAEGLAKLLETVTPRDSELPAGVTRPEVRSRIRVTAEGVQGDSAVSGTVNVKEFRDAVLAAAATLNPLTPPGEFDPQSATVAVAIPSHLGVAVARVTALEPLTTERFRMADPMIVARRQRSELIPDGDNAAADAPFSLERLKERHRFEAGRNSERDEEEATADAGSTRVGG